MLPSNVQDVLDAVVKRDGYFTTHDMERAEGQIPWNEPRPTMNANPRRWKLCPVCLHSQPIAEFLIESAELRTVVRLHLEAQEEFAYPVANVSEYCRSCEI